MFEKSYLEKYLYDVYETWGICSAAQSLIMQPLQEQHQAAQIAAQEQKRRIDHIADILMMGLQTQSPAMAQSPLGDLHSAMAVTTATASVGDFNSAPVQPGNITHRTVFIAGAGTAVDSWPTNLLARFASRQDTRQPRNGFFPNAIPCWQHLS